MGKPVDEYSDYWNYLSQNQKDLILEGQYLMNNIIKEHTYHFKDYSFLVFPFAKAYEGYLKQLFLDIGFISRLDYISDHLRLGKLMSPNLIMRLGDRSLYLKIKQAADEKLAEDVWNAWKMGRNQIFHYFPHNIKSITFDEAEKIIGQLIQVMETVYERLRMAKTMKKLKNFI